MIIVIANHPGGALAAEHPTLAKRGNFPTESHTRASSLGKLSAGIGNPCDQAGSCRLGHLGRTTITRLGSRNLRIARRDRKLSPSASLWRLDLAAGGPGTVTGLYPLVLPAAPLRGITPIATLERFVLYCSSELIISGRAPGRGPEGTGNRNRHQQAHIGLRRSRLQARPEARPPIGL